MGRREEVLRGLRSPKNNTVKKFKDYRLFEYWRGFTSTGEYWRDEYWRVGEFCRVG